MKKIYLIFIFISTICYSQDEALLGQWTLDSIWDADIFYYNPVNPIATEFGNNTITIESFCGETYQSLYASSPTENAINITESNWAIINCAEDNEGWEFAINVLFNIENDDIKELTYVITENGSTSSLEISYYYTHFGDITTSTTGYYTKQNSPPEIIGEWFLYSFNSDGVNYENNFGDLPIDFFEEVNGSSEFNGDATCNSFTGPYDVNGNQLSIFNVGTTLANCPGPLNDFEFPYIDLISNNYTYPSVFSYEILGAGSEQVLTLTNADGDYIVYGKIEPNTILNRTWYLQTINSDGLTYEVSPESYAYLSLSLQQDPFIQNLYLNGSGDCNEFSGLYYQENDSITITEFTQTTDSCNPQTDFETVYFSLLGDDTPNTFACEIINDGNNLVLTSIPDAATRSPGDTLLFSRQQLSVEDQERKDYTITLKENPVISVLNLNLNDTVLSKSLEYTIFSVGGKTIKSSQLDTDSIDVSRLTSGLYFISFSANNQTVSTVKFIKK